MNHIAFQSSAIIAFIMINSSWQMDKQGQVYEKPTDKRMDQIRPLVVHVISQFVARIKNDHASYVPESTSDPYLIRFFFRMGI